MPVTPAGLISTITTGILLPARLLAEDLTKATLKEGSPNLLKVALKCIRRKVTSESTSSHSAGHEFADDPHQIIPTEDIFTISAILREDLKGFNEGYLLPAEVTAF